MSKSKKENAFLNAVKNLINMPTSRKPLDNFLMDSIKVFARLNQPYVILNYAGKILYANTSFLELLEAKELPQDIAGLMSKKDFKDFSKKTENVFSFEDSSVLPINITFGQKAFSAVADISYLTQHEDVKYAALTLRAVASVKDSKNTESNLLKSCTYLNTLFSTLPMALYIRDRKGNIVMSNALASEILGPGAEAIDKAALKLGLSLDSKVFESGIIYDDSDIHFKDISGKDRVAHLIKAPVKDEDGNITTVLTLFEDITARRKQEESVLRDKNLLQSILDYAPMALYTRGAKGGLTFWNKKTMDIFEDTEETVGAKGVHKNQKKEDAESYQTREEEIIREGKVVIYPQEAYTTREGNNIMLHLIKVPIPAKGNEPACVLTIAQDITERYIQEQETFKTQNVLQTIFNNAPVAIYARDNHGDMLFRNRKTLEIHGCSEEDSLKETPEQKDFYIKREKSILKGGKLLDLQEEEYLGPDGKKRVIHAIKVPVYDTDGKPLMVVTIGEDVTQSREKEREILRSKNFLQEVIDNLPVALFAKKYTGEYLLWNKKSEELFAKKAEEVIGKMHHNDEINPEQEEFIRMQDQKVFDVGHELDIPQELISTQKEGIKIMHTVKTPLFFEDGTPNCLLGISEDITAKTKMEKQVYESKTKYSLLVENSREGILIIEQGKISFANKTFLTALGYLEEDVQDKTFEELAAKENAEIAKEFYDKVIAGTAARDFAVVKMQNKNKDEVFEFEASAAVSKYLGKKILIMFLRNITNERHIEQNVKTKDDKFRQVFENSDKPFVILQHNGYIYEMNRAARDIFGFDKEDKALYCSIYIKPGLPLSARKAIAALDSAMFEGEVNFDKLKETLPGIVKDGKLDLLVNMIPVNERELANGKVAADYLVELKLKGASENIQGEAQNSILGGDILAYQDAVLLCSREGIVLKCNMQAEHLLNLSLNKIQGRLLSLFFSQNDALLMEADINELYSQGLIKSRNYNLKKEGSFLPVEATAIVAKNNNFLISFRNNSARKQLLDLLNERSNYAEALSTVFDSALLECDIEDGVFSQFTHVNNSASSIIGLSRAKLMSLSLSDLLTDPERKEHKTVLNYLAAKAEQLKKDKTISFEAKLQLPEKTLFVTVRISRFETESGEKAVITLRDSSQEKFLKTELACKSNELAGIKDVLPGLYLVVDAKGVIQEYRTTDMRYNISVFPSDFLGKSPYEYLSKENADSLISCIQEALETDIPVHTSFSMQYGEDHRFYEASVARIKGEKNAVALVNRVDRRKGLENRIHDLYAFSSNRDADFVDNMNDILEFGKQIFGADVGLICRFSGRRKEKILINYATKNEFNILKGTETPVEECFESVLSGDIFACNDTSEDLGCKKCLHVLKNVSSIISAPLYLDGRVEGAISFLTVAPNKMMINDEDKNFMGFIGGLMGMALEIRQAKKAVDNGISTLKHIIGSIDLPAVILDKSLSIKNINDVMKNICGIYDIVEVEDRNFFNKIALDPIKAEGDFRSAFKTSRGGVFDIMFDIVISDGRPLSLLWHAVEVKDGKGIVRGFLLISESVKDMAAVKGLLRGPMSHI